MGTYPLVNDGHPSIFKELQVLCGRLKPHHFWQQPFQLLQFYKNTEQSIYSDFNDKLLLLTNIITTTRPSYHSIVITITH